MKLVLFAAAFVLFAVCSADAREPVLGHVRKAHHQAKANHHQNVVNRINARQARRTGCTAQVEKVPAPKTKK